MTELEKRGVATVALTADAFVRDARRSAENFGLPGLPLAVVPLPFTNRRRDAIRSMVTNAFDAICGAVTSHGAVGDGDWRSELVRIEDPWLEFEGADAFEAHDAMDRAFLEYGWSDGFPLRPATEARLDAMLRAVSRSGDDVVAVLEPGFGIATVVGVAANAIMAGCQPEHLPVVIAALEAMAEPIFDLRMKAMSTGPQAPLLVVNGPVAKRLHINSGRCALGPGSLSYANTVIGRAVRLCMMNLGHCYPDVSDMDTLGSPNKYSLCVAENEAESPWDPYHVEHGYDHERSTVTVEFVYGLCELHDFESQEPEQLIQVFATAALNLGQVPTGMWLLGRRGDPRAGTSEKEHAMVFVAPEHAAIFASRGWDKAQIRKALHEAARLSFDKLSLRINPKAMELSHPELSWLWEKRDTLVHVLEDEDAFDIAVVGGPAGRSAYFWGAGQPSTKPIRA